MSARAGDAPSSAGAASFTSVPPVVTGTVARYAEVGDAEEFEHGVVRYLDGEDDAVAAQGYVVLGRMRGDDESTTIVAEPDHALHVPVRRGVHDRYPNE